MGLKDWRTRRGMTDPVPGEFRVSGTYYPHPGSTPVHTMLTGVVVADGVPPTPGEHLDRHAIGEFRRTVPVLVDRADPTHFVVLWDEVAEVDPRAEARRRAEADAQRLQRDGGPAARYAGGQPAGEIPAAPPAPVTVTGLDDLPPWLQKAVGAALDGDTDAGAVTVSYGTPGTAVATGPPLSGWPAGRAVLVGVTDVPVPAYALPGPTASLCDLALQVTRPDGSAYAVSTRMGFRSAERRTRLAAPGAVVPVHVDPADETHVEIDIAAWDAAAR